LPRVELRVIGRVQGVFYRASTRTEAKRLGLRGWVRNEADGSVRLVAEGSREALDALVRWCHQGPAGARVDHVEATGSDTDDPPLPNPFEIRR
jgi:acylphosphatase